MGFIRVKKATIKNHQDKLYFSMNSNYEVFLSHEADNGIHDVCEGRVEIRNGLLHLYPNNMDIGQSNNELIEELAESIRSFFISRGMIVLGPPVVEENGELKCLYMK